MGTYGVNNGAEAGMAPDGSDIAQGGSPFGRNKLDRLLAELRPKLHRYCARMTGSVIDGEDVLQDAIIKAIEALPRSGEIHNPEGWLFRITHNTALDFIRRRNRHEAAHSDEDVRMIAAPAIIADGRLAVAASLRSFMQLPASQRSSVILKDVLDYSIEEIAQLLEGATIASVKATLHRGRARLRELNAAEPLSPRTPTLSENERRLLAAYIDRFNARDFDTMRDMLADEVRLDLVARARLKGRAEVSTYYGYYEKLMDWRFALGAVEGRPAALALDPQNLGGPPIYFVLLRWDGGRLIFIRDFRYARYVTDGLEFTRLARE
jgi:RNA polymerase sigma-70 factor (ECF subfamily)